MAGFGWIGICIGNARFGMARGRARWIGWIGRFVWVIGELFVCPCDLSTGKFWWMLVLQSEFVASC